MLPTPQCPFHFSAGSLSSMRIKIATFNVGLLRLHICGNTLLENPEGTLRRAPLVARDIRGSCMDADVVCVQECYEQQHRDAIRDAMQPDYPFMATSHYHTVLNSGLMTFSKHPVRGSRRAPHTDAFWYERMFGDRAMLVATVHPLGGTPFTVVNAHLSSGIPADGPDAARMRKIQINDISREIANEGSELVIVAGDFNCSPTVTPDCYREMLALGWEDAWVGMDDQYSWDKTNPLNASKPTIQGASQRCDQVWIARGNARILSSAIYKRNDLSDHYLVASEILVTSEKRRRR